MSQPVCFPSSPLNFSFRCILLENADQVWSSSYDMLNQHYMIVGGRRHCRIALGSYSNPMCYVHDSFRCIVVVDVDQIPAMDPPFLNRFEKQVFTYESILDETRMRAVQSVRLWAHELATMSCSGSYHHESQIIEQEVFAGYHEDSVPSLVMLHFGQAQDADSPDSWLRIVDRCAVLTKLYNFLSVPLPRYYSVRQALFSELSWRIISAGARLTCYELHMWMQLLGPISRNPQIQEVFNTGRRCSCPGLSCSAYGTVFKLMCV